MKDYSFGNFISELRRRNGLSQFQLGTLIGVSNKAVSKWENGSAKPKITTCHKLALVLGVSIDELLACKYHTSVPAEKGIFAMKNKLWKKAEDRLHEVYGKYPHVSILGRFETEKQLILFTLASLLLPSQRYRTKALNFTSSTSDRGISGLKNL